MKTRLWMIACFGKSLGFTNPFPVSEFDSEVLNRFLPAVNKQLKQAF